MKKISVVIVDDENNFQWTLTDLLTKNGILVSGSFTRNQFLKHTKLEQEPDIIAITFDTPRFLSELTVVSVRQHYPSIKILMYSVFEDRKNIEKIMGLDVDGLVFKKSDDYYGD